MPKRDTLGWIAFVVALLLQRVWIYGWEWVRSQLEDATVKWLESTFSGISRIDLGGDFTSAVLIGIALWLWRPHIEERVPFFRPKYISFDDAALRLYEADEKAGDEWSLAASDAKSPQAKLDHFKYALLCMREEIFLYGKRRPSTQLLPIPSDERKSLYPTDNTPNALSSGVVTDEADYTDVSIRQRDLRRAIRSYLFAARTMARFEQKKVQQLAVSSRRQEAIVPLSIERVPLLEYRNKAVAHGWPGQLQDARWLTFLHELRQAASDGTVAMWGRRMKKPSAGVLYGKKDPPEPLLEIDKTHWATFEVDPFTFLSTEADARPSSYDKSKSDHGFSAGRYTDLHAGAGATEWLATTKVSPL